MILFVTDLGTLAPATITIFSSPTLVNVLKRDPLLLPSGDREDLVRMQEDVDMAIEGCQRAVEDYQRAIRAFRSQRNACADICRLPDELLEEILSHTADEQRGSISSIAVSQVCRHWRGIALGCARLWSNISATHKTRAELVRTLLVRSRASPLDVRVSISPSHEGRPQEMLRMILDELPRIHHFQAALPHALYEAVASKFCSPAPQLRSMSLSYVSTLGGHDHEAMPLPMSVFPGGLPMLKVLTVDGFRVPWALSLARPTVTHLTLHSPIRVIPDSSSAQVLLETLRRMPALVTLELGGCVLPLDLPDLSIDKYPVALPLLTHLRLSGKIANFTWLLNHLHLSPYINLDLDTRVDCAIPGDVLISLGQSVIRTFSPPDLVDAPPLIPMHHAAFYQIEPHISCANSGLHFILANKRDDICEYFEVGEAVGQPRRVQGAKRMLHLLMSDKFLVDERPDLILQGLQLWNMHTLVLGTLPGIKLPSSRTLQPSFLDCLFHFHSIQHLIVRGWEADWIRELLAPDPTKYTTTRSPPDPFPRLVQLILRATPMGGGARRDPKLMTDIARRQPGSPMHVLRQMFQARRERRGLAYQKPKELFLSDCPGLTDDIVAVLEQEVERCIWYGIQG